ncbi:MAG: hypothetical protein Q9161_008625 [Pseudevernia consocians]
MRISSAPIDDGEGPDDPQNGPSRAGGSATRMTPERNETAQDVNMDSDSEESGSDTSGSDTSSSQHSLVQDIPGAYREEVFMSGALQLDEQDDIADPDLDSDTGLVQDYISDSDLNDDAGLASDTESEYDITDQASYGSEDSSEGEVSPYFQRRQPDPVLDNDAGLVQDYIPDPNLNNNAGLASETELQHDTTDQAPQESEDASKGEDLPYSQRRQPDPYAEIQMAKRKNETENDDDPKRHKTLPTTAEREMHNLC